MTCCWVICLLSNILLSDLLLGNILDILNVRCVRIVDGSSTSGAISINLKRSNGVPFTAFPWVCIGLK